MTSINNGLFSSSDETRAEEFLSLLESASTHVRAGGDRYVGPIGAKRTVRWPARKKLGDVDSRSSDSLQVNIGDLADAEELKKIAQVVNINHQPRNSFSHLIEETHILHGFRQHSQDILAILSRKDMTSSVFSYGERDTGRKLLSIAAETDWYDGVVFLLNRGVDINETDRENRTALMDCLTSTDTKIILALVKKPHCNLDIQTITGHTASHYAVMMNKIPFFEILIRSGARLDLLNDKGENVLHQIIRYKRKECWKLVKSVYGNHSPGHDYLKHLIHAETYEHKTCLTLAFEHRPMIYFFKELLSYCDRTLLDRESYQSWPKAYKFI